MNIKDEQQMAEHFGQPGPMDRIRQKTKGERAYTNDEIAEHENLAAEIRAKLDDYQPERMRAALAALRGGAQTPVTDELVNAGAQALADDVWHPPQKLSFLSPSDQNKFRRQSRTVIEAIRSVGLRGALAQAVDEHASMLSEGERREDAGDVPTLIELAIEREEKYLHDLIDDEAVGSVMHGDIEGAFHRLNAALTAARDTEGK